MAAKAPEIRTHRPRAEVARRLFEEEKT